MTPRPVGQPHDMPPRHEVAVLLLRHAWAIDRQRWVGDDRERPLDGRGRAQALALPGHLAANDLVPVRLVATPTERSRATLVPLSRTTGLEIHEDERFTDQHAPLRCDDDGAVSAWRSVRAMAGLDAIARVEPFGPSSTRRPSDAEGHDLAGPAPADPDVAMSPDSERVVVICSHGEVLPALLAGLAARDGWRLEHGPDLTRKAMAKGGGWLLTRSSDQVVVIDPPVIPETTDPGQG